MKNKFKGKPLNSCPTYFRVGCENASQRNNSGYDVPSWHLSIHLVYDIFDFDEGEIAVSELEELVGKEDDGGIIRWFRYYLPNCMKLVPYRRNISFLKGFWLAIQQERVF